MPKTAHFCPLTAHFGGFQGFFSFVTDKSAILCPGKTEVAGFVSFKDSIVHEIKNIKIKIIFLKPIDKFQKSSILIRFNGAQLDGRLG